MRIPTNFPIHRRSLTCIVGDFRREVPAMSGSPLRSIKLTVAVVVLALIIGACGGSPQQGGPAQQPADEGSAAAASPTGEEVTFSEQDLKDLVLQEQEAPKGFSPFSPAHPVEVKDTAFPSAPAGFESGYGGTFATEAGEQYANSFAYLFRDASTASAALASLEEGIPLEAEEFGAKRVRPSAPPEGLGEEAIAFIEEWTGGSVFDYAWRVGNVVLSMQVSGPDEDEATALAETVDSHAE
jgi:hypothetical protein